MSARAQICFIHSVFNRRKFWTFFKHRSIEKHQGLSEICGQFNADLGMDDHKLTHIEGTPEKPVLEFYDGLSSKILNKIADEFEEVTCHGH